MNLPRVNSYTNWGRLEEVWLGDCYPAHFYDHYDSNVRDVFYEITEKTQQDLAVIQCKLEEFGVVVQRPRYDNIDSCLTPNDTLIKPQITPRDYYLASGNSLIGDSRLDVWNHVVEQYRNDPGSTVHQQPISQHLGRVCGANTVRAGRDLYLDVGYGYDKNSTLEQRVNEYHQRVAPLFKDYRMHLLFNGGHVDGCFAAIKPGVLITSKYFTDYDRTFPGWAQINILNPEFHNFHNRRGPGYNGKWWDSGRSNSPEFNEHIIKHALDWVGDYTETYFEINCLVIDEKNVLMMGENHAIFRELERYGITAHSLPFRTRTFWDGGLHCLTLDIRRQDSLVDLFPERDQSLYLYNNP